MPTPNANYPDSASAKVASLYGVSDNALLDEESLFIVTNPTPGTVIATTTSITAETEASPVLMVQNGWSATDANRKTIYLRYLNMLLGQVPTSATDWQLSIRSDANSAAYTSGGSTNLTGGALTVVNANLASSRLSKANVMFGAIVAVATQTASKRLLARRQINSAVPVTKDQWSFTFGIPGSTSDQISGGAGAKNAVFAMPAIAIPPGYNVRLNMWGGANAAAPSWEFELGFVERVPGL